MHANGIQAKDTPVLEEKANTRGHLPVKLRPGGDRLSFGVSFAKSIKELGNQQSRLMP